MTAHSLIATGQRRTQGNIKETQPRRRFVDLTQFGFKFADWNKWSFEFVGITFTLIPRPGGGWQVEDHPLSFDLNTKPIEIAWALKELACDLMRAQGEAADPLDADWLTECLPDAEVTPGLGAA